MNRLLTLLEDYFPPLAMMTWVLAVIWLLLAYSEGSCS